MTQQSLFTEGPPTSSRDEGRRSMPGTFPGSPTERPDESVASGDGDNDRDQSLVRSVISAIVTPVTAARDELLSIHQPIAIRPELLKEAAETVSQFYDLVQAPLDLDEYLTLPRPVHLESAILNASRATEAVKKCDPGFSRLRSTLENPDGEYQLPKGSAWPVIEALKTYRDEDRWYRATS